MLPPMQLPASYRSPAAPSCQTETLPLVNVRSIVDRIESHRTNLPADEYLIWLHRPRVPRRMVYLRLSLRRATGLLLDC